jgi:hypothetical protein
MLDPEQYYLLEEFCKNEKIPVPSPEWSKVVAAIDTETEKVVGVIVCQLQVHTEPIWIKKEYQGKGLWEMMADAMEGYLEMLAFSSGGQIGAWNQPTNAAAERICRLRGYVKGDRPLWYKMYDGSTLERSLRSWQQQSLSQSEEQVPL